MKYEVFGDGNTVWVNGEDGTCLARFGKLGIDVHKTTEAQIASGKQCLDCTHGKPKDSDWERFVNCLAEVYGVSVPAKLKPNFLKGEKCKLK